MEIPSIFMLHYFINKHSCNTDNIVYKTIREGKNRCVVKNLTVDKVNFDTPNEKVVVVCYDIETHTRCGFDGMKIHTPYIVGFVNNIEGKFQYFAGKIAWNNL